MLFLLDTNAVSDYMRGDVRITSRLSALGQNDTAVICSIVKGQILFGITRLPHGQRRSKIELAAAMTLPALRCFPVPESAADLYASTKFSCQRKGIVLDENDLWIAATALAIGATLVTRDKDFSQVDGLTVQDWTT